MDPPGSPFILGDGFVAVGYTGSIRVKAHNHSVIIDCVGLGVDGSGRVYGDEFPPSQEIALPNTGTVSAIHPDDISFLVNPASTSTNQAVAVKMDGLKFAGPVAHKSVNMAVGTIKGTYQHSTVILSHVHLLEAGAGNVDFVKCPIFQE